jgi:hypothetical protein
MLPLLRINRLHTIVAIAIYTVANVQCSFFMDYVFYVVCRHCLD